MPRWFYRIYSKCNWIRIIVDCIYMRSLERNRYRLKKSDGKHGYQLNVFSKDDLEYWTKEVKKKGYRFVFDRHIPKDAFGYPRAAHDIYQAR